MPLPFPDRRRRRSSDIITALHYQLASTRAEARLEALVLVDPSGCLVAGAGAWPACEELAAYAPLLAHPGAARTAAVSSRIAALSAVVEVQTFAVDGGEALICGRGDQVEGGSGAANHAFAGAPGPDPRKERRAALAHAAAGCRRILRGVA